MQIFQTDVCKDSIIIGLTLIISGCVVTIRHYLIQRIRMQVHIYTMKKRRGRDAEEEGSDCKNRIK